MTQSNPDSGKATPPSKEGAADRKAVAAETLRAANSGQDDKGGPARGVRARFARQSDQAPPASLDRPWDNLHPERIWPD